MFNLFTTSSPLLSGVHAVLADPKESKEPLPSAFSTAAEVKAPAIPTSAVTAVPRPLATARALMRGRLLGKIVPTTFGWSSTFNTTAAGTFNTTANVNSLPTILGEFINWAALFDEFFVHKMALHYIPFDRYQVLDGVTIGTQHTSTPLVAVPLFHGVATYGSMVGSLENELSQPFSSADPFRITWLNAEDPRTKMLVNPSTSVAGPTQGWCLTQATPASAYTGQVQFISSNAIGPGTGVIAAGQLYYRWSVSFRVRA